MEVTGSSSTLPRVTPVLLPAGCVFGPGLGGKLTTILASRTVFSGTVTQYSGCSQCGGWLWTLVMMTVSSTELLRLPPSDATICWLILDVCGGGGQTNKQVSVSSSEQHQVQV